ncbi:MAG: sulfopyruvate decarboxylase subunit alpha [Deltaproteobacteria bacterium]|nr:sulfopyruvate decarboxylase subunit alpha [Deltaproteobacteria bacterium]
MSQHKAFLEKARALGFNFFTGVPCSLLKGAFAELEKRSDFVPATREDSALGMAAGAYLAGKKAMVLMQNSGLGVSVNAVVSLNAIYKIPCVMVISWRGYQGKDAPEHIIMGEITHRLLDTIGVPHRSPDAEGLLADLSWANDEMAKRRAPVALVVREGVCG